MDVNDIKFIARGRPHWEEWKLGDSILACSVLARFKNVRLHVENINTQGNKLLKELSETVFSDSYEFEMVKEIPGKYKIISPDQFYLENNLETVRPNQNLLITDNVETYVTIQTKSNNNRSINLDITKQHTGKYKLIDLSNAKNEGRTLKDIFNIVGNAKKHVGAASGISWVAMSTRVPTTILMPSSFRKGGWDYALECMYRSKVVQIQDV